MTFILLILLSLVFSCVSQEKYTIELNTTADISSEKQIFSSSTQSFLRLKHNLQKNKELMLTLEGDKASIYLKGYDIKNIDLSDLIPILPYKVKGKASNFDLINLRIMEYNRRGIAYARGPFDEGGYFLSEIEQNSPWFTANNYELRPNPNFTPLRISIINNCLFPGLWELSANDQSGELFHGWFNFPKQKYYELVAKKNNLTISEVKKALAWNTKMAPFEAANLRKVQMTSKKLSLKLNDGPITYSTNDSRRKVQRKFFKTKNLEHPKYSDILSEVKFRKFIPPGIYSDKEWEKFNLDFLKEPIDATISKVIPLTRTSHFLKSDHYVEIILNFKKHKIILGNIPLSELSEFEDFPVYTFGPDGRPTAELAERNELRQKFGSTYYAYLIKNVGEKPMVVNQHAFGIEQAFIRFTNREGEKGLKIIVSSYERIVDIAEFFIDLEYLPELASAIEGKKFTTPIHRSYKDDNTR